MSKNPKKFYGAAIILSILYIMEIFWLSDILGNYFGLFGTVMHEMLLAMIGVGVFVVLRENLKEVFPFKKIRISKILGTFFVWLGTYVGTLFITTIIVYYFPEEVMSASQGIQEIIVDMPMAISIIVVSVVPAICEEIAFRGALLGCFRKMGHRWIGIIVVAAIFGACHGSVWRMIPTMILGIGMGYLLCETDNLIYPMLFHFINNAVPVALISGLKKLTESMGLEYMMDASVSSFGMEQSFVTLPEVLIYCIITAICIYIGNRLLHYGEKNNSILLNEECE